MLTEQIKATQENGMIKEALSAYCSPLTTVSHKNKVPHTYVDARKINRITIADTE
jgi:hypothetical protein